MNVNWDDFFDEESEYNRTWDQIHNDYNYVPPEFRTDFGKDLASESFIATRKILRRYEQRMEI